MPLNLLSDVLMGTMGVLFRGAKKSGCVNCGHTKHLKKKFEQLKLKAEGLYSVRDAMKEDMNRELMQGNLDTSECQTWLEVVEEIENEVHRINVEIERGTRCLTVCCCSNLLDEHVAKVMDEISVHLEKSTFEPSSMVHGPQDGGNPITSSKMDGDRPEMMVHGPGDRGKTIIASIMDAVMLQGREFCRSSNAEAMVISKDEITPSEKAKQKKARRTGKAFSIEEINERKEAGIFKEVPGQRRVRASTQAIPSMERRKAAIRKEESGQRKQSAQIKETQHEKGAETSPVWFFEGDSTATQAKESVVMPEQITIFSPPKSEIMSEPSDEEIQLSRPLPSMESQMTPKALEVSVPESSSIPTMAINWTTKQNPVARMEVELKSKPIYVSREEEVKPEIEMEVISSERKEDSKPKLETEVISSERSEDSQMTITTRGKSKRGILSSSNEEHKEVVLMDSSSSLSRARLLEHLEGIFSPFSDGYYYMIKENMGLTEAPKEEEWVQAHVISLMGNKFSVLPESPKCERLLKLSLKRNYRLRAIPESFFKYMPALQVLELSETRIKSLPLFLDLPSLRVLLLRDCERLAVLPPQVGSLKSLEILDLQGTDIKELPNEVGELTRLMTLQLSFHGYDSSSKNVKFPPELIPGGILSKLFLLKDVSIVVDPEDQRWNKNVKSVTEELGNLNQLSTLHFYFPEGDCLERFLQISTSWNAHSMSKFRFIVGHHVKRFVSRVPDTVELEYEKRDKCLRFVNGKNVSNALVEVLKCSTAFYLDRHCGIYSLSDIGIENMNNLEFCIIRECHEMRTVIDGLEVIVEGVLPSLEHLKIHYSQNLTSICKGLVQPGSLIKLKSLALYTCPKLSYIFTLSMFDSLSNLEEMVVEDCQSLKVLITEGVIEGDVVVIPRLKRLSLRYLPELVSMGKAVSSWHSLENIDIFNCQNLKSISLDSKSAANIKEIKGEKDWWSALEWEESAILLQLGPRFVPICDDALLKSD